MLEENDSSEVDPHQATEHPRVATPQAILRRRCGTSGDAAEVPLAEAHVHVVHPSPLDAPTTLVRDRLAAIRINLAR